MPKSSIASCTPRRLRPWRTARASSVWFMMKLSVISSCSRDGSRPDCSSSCSRRSISCGWPSWAPARLTDSGPNGACSFAIRPSAGRRVPAPSRRGAGSGRNPRRGDEALGKFPRTADGTSAPVPRRRPASRSPGSAWVGSRAATRRAEGAAQFGFQRHALGGQVGQFAGVVLDAAAARDLARYMAASAFFTRVGASSPSLGNRAMPTLALTKNS